MDIEILTDLLTKKILLQTDVECNGGFVEIGLGNINFSFIWAQKLGFACYAVEPLPSAHLKEQARKHKVELTEAAIAEASGQVPIHIGSLDGMNVSDISSLHPDWWGGGSETKMVPSMSFKDYITQKEIQKISCLKVDTEGSELSVIASLPSIQNQQLPQLIVFEYGGGGTRLRQEGGWKPKFFQNTLACLRTLKSLKYTSVVVVEQNSDQVRAFELAAVDDLERIFPIDAEVGNVICTRNNLAAADLRQYLASIHFKVLAVLVGKHIQGTVRTIRYYMVRFSNGILRRIFPKSGAQHGR